MKRDPDPEEYLGRWAGPMRDVADSPSEVRLVLLAQGGYYVATGAVPFVSRRAFEAATGPKQEWWLVQTVAALATVIGGALICSALRREAPAPVLVLAAGSATAFSAIDVVYVARRRIARTYLIDAGANVGVLVALLVNGFRRPSWRPTDAARS